MGPLPGLDVIGQDDIMSVDELIMHCPVDCMIGYPKSIHCNAHLSILCASFSLHSSFRNRIFCCISWLYALVSWPTEPFEVRSMLFIGDAMSRGESKEYWSKGVLSPEPKVVEAGVMSSRRDGVALSWYRPVREVTLHCYIP